MKEFEQRNCLSQEEIKQYLEETLNTSQQRSLENHLLDCPLCSDAIEGFAAMQNMEMKEALDSLDKRYEANKTTPAKLVKMTPRPRIQPIYFKMAAAILLLLMPIAIMMYWGESKNQLQYAEFAGNFPNDFDYSKRTDDSSKMKEEPFFKALQLYDNKDYAESLKFLQIHLQDSITDMPATFFAGVCKLYTGKTEDAVEMLEIVKTSPNTGYEADATWYLALAKLKQGDTKRAKNLASLLTQSDNYYNKRAAELLLVLD